MEIEVSMQLYELLLTEATETGSAIEEFAERAFKNFMERNEHSAD